MGKYICLVALKDSGGWHLPGSVIELSDTDAREAAMKKVIAAIEIPKSTPTIEPSQAQAQSENPVSSSEEGSVVDGVIDVKQVIAELSAVKGINTEIAQALINQGCHGILDLQAMSIEQLMGISGIGKKKAQTILSDANEFVVEDDE